jgi:hypothetical protein
MTPINKFIVLTAVAALMIGTLVPASDQAYAEVTIIIGSDVTKVDCQQRRVEHLQIC